MSWQVPAFWLLLSVLIAIGLRISQRITTPTWHTRFYWLLWFLIPYCGLLTGGLSPRLMGLGAIDWQTSLSLGLSLCFGVLIALALVRATVASGPVAFAPVTAEPEQQELSVTASAGRARATNNSYPSALQTTLSVDCKLV
jgi:hypothetical protein